ncbi:MAG: hypothetical protein JWN74_1125 [Acidobacteriaceae bacterium]|nr:hypothetical protein [Acidobacteriaceae bacterium]
MMSNSHRVRVLIAAFAVVAMSISFCSPALAASSNPILVELFTSEGCSSCPPAETLLRTLDSAQPVLGAQLIVLEEHVDYWDDQGWQDPFSAHAFTVRQSTYVERLHLNSGPYTPQMVVDGNEAFVGSDRAQAGRALAKAVAIPKVNVEILSAHVENGKVQAHVKVAEVSSKADVFLALALDHAQSQVLRGENGGRRLEHVAVVKRLTAIGQTKKGEPFSKDVTIALDHPGQAYRLIAFVQEASEGKVLGATVTRLQ